MPEEYTLENIAQPNDDRVTLEELPAKKYVAIRFSGLSSQDNLDQNREELRNYIREHGLEPVSEPIYAFYNPPISS